MCIFLDFFFFVFYFGQIKKVLIFNLLDLFEEKLVNIACNVCYFVCLLLSIIYHLGLDPTKALSLGFPTKQDSKLQRLARKLKLRQ